MPPRRRPPGLSRELTRAVGLSVALAVPCTAQETGAASSAHRHAVVVSGDAGSLPNAFQDPGCGDVTGDYVPEVGVGASVIDRLTSSFFLAADVRVSSGFVAVGCETIIPSPIEVAPGIWETRYGFRRAPGTPQVPLIRNLLRAGFETPANYPAIIRAALGGGFIWSSRSVPMATASVALSSSGAGRRLFVEAERDIAWFRLAENRSQFRQDSIGARTPLADYVVTRKTHPAWTTVRLGFEWPWA